MSIANVPWIVRKIAAVLDKTAPLGRYDLHFQIRKWRRLISYFAHAGKLTTFSELAIETTSHCNRHCGFCPVSVAPRGKEVMDEALFAKLLGELADLKYSGRIALHFFNEPLLDKDIVAKVRRIAVAAPRASIEIFSNGDFLTPPLFADLVTAGLSFMLTTAYSERALQRLEKMREQLGWRLRSRLIVRRAPDFKGNRAGSLVKFAIPQALAADCFQPSYKLVINYRGEAVICTNDYFSKVVVGHVADQTLIDIWRGPVLTDIRQTLQRHERDKLASCAGCNQINTPLHSRDLTAAEAIAHNGKQAQRAKRLPGVMPNP